MKVNSNISVFDGNSSKESIIEYDGYVLDKTCIECFVTEGLDGNYILDAKFVCNDEKELELLEKENVIKVRLDYGEEIFKINKRDVNSNIVTIVARQITIAETLALWVQPLDGKEYVEGYNAQSTMQFFYDKSVGRRKNIIVSSDMYKADPNMIAVLPMSLYESYNEQFCDYFGGEFLRRGYNLSINKRVGSDRGVTIEEGKNLKGFNISDNLDNLCTRIKPVGGKDALTIKGYVESPLIDNYADIYTKQISYDDIFVEDENNPGEGYKTKKEAQDELVRRAALEFSVNKIDEIKMTYDINFIQLEQTEEYKNYAAAERVYIGDTVSVYLKKYKISVKLRAISRKYNVLTQRTTEITLSNTADKGYRTTQEIVNDLVNEYESNNNPGIAAYIDSMIKAGVKDSYVVLRQNELLIMDNKDLNLAVNVTRYNKNGLGFSQDGYYGTYKYGFTIDGKINASLIATGVLSAILIRSMDGKNWFNLETGEINFEKGKIKGSNLLIDLDAGIIKFAKGLIEGKNLILNLDTGKVKFTTGEILGKNLSLNLDTGEILSKDDNGNSVLYKENGMVFGKNIELKYFNNTLYITLKGNPVMRVGTDTFDFVRFGEGSIDSVFDGKNISIRGNNIVANGNFSVSGGTKNCIQNTENYGDRLFYSVEDCGSYLTLRSDNQFTVEPSLEGLYERVILIDNIFKESVDLKLDYDVAIHKVKGRGWWEIEEKTEDYFKVISNDPTFAFHYVVTAKRKGYENCFLEEFFMPVMEEGV